MPFWGRFNRFQLALFGGTRVPQFVDLQLLLHAVAAAAAAAASACHETRRLESIRLGPVLTSAAAAAASAALVVAAAIPSLFFIMFPPPQGP